MVYGKFPLNRLLKGKLLRIAEMQDKLVIELASRFGIILHGGTAIWRMYRGKRFSFDIDIYSSDPAEILEYFKKSEAFKLVRGKLTSSDVLYMRFQEGNTLVEVEASPLFKKMQTTDGEFYLVGGDSIVLKTLTASELLREKINAFRSRSKARDLYDIFCLTDIADTSKIKNDIRSLLPFLKVAPDDFPGLKELILVGKTPDFETIVRKVRGYAKD